MQAGQLSDWQFSGDRNQLEFTTNAGVQPRAQLLENPTRLVIDLPGTTVGQVATSQAIGQTVRQIRVGQLDAQTTRIIVELAPGYTIDPQQVKFHGFSPTQWTVQLPDPQPEASSTAIAPIQNPPPISHSPVSSLPPANSSLPANSLPSIHSAPSAPVPSAPVPSAPVPSAPVPSAPAPSALAQASRSVASAHPMPQAATQIEEVRLTADGLFVRTTGDRPELSVERGRRDRDIITITVANASLSPQITQPIAINQYGISTLELSQAANQRSPSVQITLHVAKNSPDWQAFASGAGGIVMLPQGGISAVARLAPPAARPAPAPSSSAIAASRSALALQSPALQSPALQSPAFRLPSSQSASEPQDSRSQEPQAASTAATIAGVELNPTSNQLLIHSDRPVSYSGRWQSGLYQITLSPAQLADRVTGSDIGGAASPVLRVQLRQQTENTVVISVQPAAGVRFGTLNLVSPQLLALQVDRLVSGVAPSAGSSARSRAGTAAVVLPNRIPSITMPRLQSGRLVVVLDPGHGGSDPGAVGINGIQEKQVTLAIAQQVAAYLTQQGVQVILTRTDDSDVELEPRVQMAEQDRANLFVSIHANSISMDRPDVNGIETYYYSSGEQMAQVIQDSIVQGTGMNDKGTHSARFYVLRRTSMPAVLIETGFVTGSDDAAHLANAGFQNQMALSIAQGILRYAQQNATALNR